MSVAIKFENVSKQYRLGEVGVGTIADDLKRTWAKLRGRPDPLAKVGQLNSRETRNEKQEEIRPGILSRISSLAARNSSSDYVWALKGIDFDVRRGEILGIIGRNGAGKSTLLKLLSRVTAPTTGSIKAKGRIASLLEVGTGFHPELTGRENVYLNGAILGMHRHEIKRQLEEIVDFSGCAKYIDTPVKRYSSGMTVRLAFAVAAHLECETLVVDEVLAVGDAEFQKKCIGKMQDVARGGRTVLFVSHNMNAIESLCARLVVLDKGGIRFNSNDVRQGIEMYHECGGDYTNSTGWNNDTNDYANSWFSPTRMYAGNQSGIPLSGPFPNNAPAYIYMDADVTQLDPALTVGYALYNADNSLIYWTVQTDVDEQNWPKLKIGKNRLRSQLPRRILNEGTYRAEMIVALYHRSWICTPGTDAPAIQFSILGGLSDSPYWTAKRPGLLGPVIDWQIMPVDNA